jgi:hypothetical protein
MKARCLPPRPDRAAGSGDRLVEPAEAAVRAHPRRRAEPGRAARLDLAFLTALPTLESVFIEGVEHIGPRPSPLRPQIAERDSRFSVFGSLADAYNLTSGQTEHDDALPIARKRLREADPKLLRRLDFDDESGATGISAPSREDLERALEIMGLNRSG